MSDLYKPREAAAYLKLGLSTLARYRSDGTGPPFSKIGRRVVYRKLDLDAWVEKHLRYSTVAKAHPETGKLPGAEGI